MVVRARNQRLRILSVTLAPDDKATTGGLVGVHIASIVLFNYTVGKAVRLLVDASTGEILTEEPIRGRPQPSEEEIQEAAKIIKQNPALGRMLQDGSILEGGFIADGPIGTPQRHRFIQMHVLTSNRRTLQRLVVVDLTSGTIAESRANY
jgi:hypothetical protein